MFELEKEIKIKQEETKSSEQKRNKRIICRGS